MRHPQHTLFVRNEEVLEASNACPPALSAPNAAPIPPPTGTEGGTNKVHTPGTQLQSQQRRESPVKTIEQPIQTTTITPERPIRTNTETHNNPSQPNRLVNSQQSKIPLEILQQSAESLARGSLGVGGIGGSHEIGQRPTLLPPATALALLWGERPCRRPRFIGPPFLPGRSRGRSASGDAFSQEIPTTGEDFKCPRPPPEKHHEHRVAQHPLSKIQRADVRLYRRNTGAHHEHQQGIGGRKASRKTP